MSNLDSYLTLRQKWIINYCRSLKRKFPSSANYNELCSYTNLYVLEKRSYFENFLDEQGEDNLDKFINTFLRNQWRWNDSPFRRLMRSKEEPEENAFEHTSNTYAYTPDTDDRTEYIEEEATESEKKLAFLEIAEHELLYLDSLIYVDILKGGITQKDFSLKNNVHPTWTSVRTRDLKKRIVNAEQLYRAANPDWRKCLLGYPPFEGGARSTPKRMVRPIGATA